MREILLKDTEQVRLVGRTAASREPGILFWTGSRVLLHVTGSELWVKLEADYETCEPWINIMINGVSVSRQMVQKGISWICVFRGMDAAKAKTVEIVKETQAMSGDPKHLLAVWAFRLDGELLPVEEKKCRLEFIGDSITSGEGAIGSVSEEEWISMWFSSERNYAWLTARALDAEYHVLSQSGWGVLSSWDNNPNGTLPGCYEQICGLQTGEQNHANGADQPWDFSSWQPDAVVINLGTNDGGAFNSPAYTDPVTGEVFKQKLLEDGSFDPADLARFQAAVVDFLKKLRRCNPKAKLVWVYGMLGIPMEPAIRAAVEQYRQESGDQEVSYLRLPDTDETSVGARSHPGYLSHERAAETLTDYLRQIL
ncbi:MAG: GDSL family lipase [Lachnospiraceae bacterium]|nr:GDSL family lipase [Lachnospiraceae bacterium]